MTNVPNDIREMWADVYRLFDANYNMTNDADSWKRFWDQATELNDKHKNRHLMALVMVVSEMLEGHLLNKQFHPCTLEDMKLF